MKKYLLFIALLFPLFIYAQPDLPNGSFENWQNVGSDTEEPIDWNSLKTGNLCGLCGAAPACCRREAGAGNVHSGTYSAKIFTNSVFGNPANGVLTLGQVVAPSTTPSDGYNITLQSNSAFNHPLGDTPDSLVFWAKYVPQDATDSARVSYVLHDNYDVRDPQDAGSNSHVVAKGSRNFRTGGSWQRIVLPINYTGPASSPNYILITFTSSKTPGAGTAGTTLYLDDATLIYNPVLTTGSISPLIYYVSATAGSTISVPFSLTGTMSPSNVVTAQLSNASGSFASPLSLGTTSTTSSGTILGTIPAGTAAGSGYRVRVTSTNYPLTAADNGANIQINLVTNSIAPTTTQTIEAGINGTAINVTESAGFISREWKYSTVSGGPYLSFGSPVTTTSYTPNFASSGTYFVVCETTYPGSLTVRSNQVQINVVNNVVLPSSAQSLLINVPGNILNVTETPAGTSRVWKYATVSGGPYNNFTPSETASTYLPLFNTAGTYYVVCQSVISGVTVTSNEVVISVGNVTLTTGSISGSPYYFSPSAPAANITVPFTVSDTLNAGNQFFAQLSDASGSFTSPLVIGNLISNLSGTINASLPPTLPEGNGYRIRVVATDPVIYGSDNGSDLVVDQFDNSIAPAGAQTILFNTNGTALTVSGSQPLVTNEWKYSTISGGPYGSFSPAQTGTSYTPNFNTIDTFYVVCTSVNNYGDSYTSNEVMIITTNGTSITTSSVSSSIYYLSPNAVVPVNVNFTSDVLFGAGNVFTAQLSDASGSFALPVTIGSLSGTSVGTINAVIPNSTVNGTGYRIRVVSSNPAIVGTPNGTDLTVIQFEAQIAPVDTQYILVNIDGNTVNATSNHPSVNYVWKYNTGLSGFLDFSPAETFSSYTPNFATAGVYQVRCYAYNMWNDTLITENVMVYVTSTAGIDDNAAGVVSTYWNGGSLVVDLTMSNMDQPVFELINISGQTIISRKLNGFSQNYLSIEAPAGIYLYRLYDSKSHTEGRFIKPD